MVKLISTTCLALLLTASVNVAHAGHEGEKEAADPVTGLRKAQAPYAGEYQIRRYGPEKASGTLKIRQNDENHIVIESCKLDGSHYLGEIKENLLLKGGRGPLDLYTKGTGKIARFILQTLPNQGYLNLDRLNPGSDNAQYGARVEFENESLDIRFHVDKFADSEDEFTLRVEYPYCYIPRKRGGRSYVSTAAPAERFILIKKGSPRHQRMEMRDKVYGHLMN